MEGRFKGGFLRYEFGGLIFGGTYFRNFTVLYWCCSAEKFPHPGIMIKLFTVKSPKRYPTRSYVARNFIMPNNVITCFVSSNVKEQDILLIYYSACFASSSSLKERDTLLCYTFIPPVSSHHSIIA